MSTHARCLPCFILDHVILNAEDQTLQNLCWLQYAGVSDCQNAMEWLWGGSRTHLESTWRLDDWMLEAIIMISVPWFWVRSQTRSRCQAVTMLIILRRSQLSGTGSGFKCSADIASSHAIVQIVIFHWTIFLFIPFCLTFVSNAKSDWAWLLFLGTYVECCVDSQTTGEMMMMLMTTTMMTMIWNLRKSFSWSLRIRSGESERQETCWWCRLHVSLVAERVHILGSNDSIRQATKVVSDLILGRPTAKANKKLHAIAGRLKQEFWSGSTSLLVKLCALLTFLVLTRWMSWCWWWGTGATLTGETPCRPLLRRRTDAPVSTLSTEM